MIPKNPGHKIDHKQVILFYVSDNAETDMLSRKLLQYAKRIRVRKNAGEESRKKCVQGDGRAGVEVLKRECRAGSQRNAGSALP
jgi:hypothetical protein